METIELLVAVPSREDERKLIARAQDGDGNAFQVLYIAHRRRIFNLCYRMIQDFGRAEELSQDAFLQAFRKLHTFRGQSAFSTWLHRIAVNVVLMHLRQARNRMHEVPIDEAATPTEERA